MQLQNGVFKDVLQQAGRQVIIHRPRHSHDTRLLRVLVLPMTAAGAAEIPTIGFEQSDQVPDFHKHVATLSARMRRIKAALSESFRCVALSFTSDTPVPVGWIFRYLWTQPQRIGNAARAGKINVMQ